MSDGRRLAGERCASDGRTRACAGRGTSNSIPGGIFARSPEIDGEALLAAYRAVEGRIGGRFNTSSTPGGPFVGEGPGPMGHGSPGVKGTPNRAAHRTSTPTHQSSIPGGIFGGGVGPPLRAAAPARDVGPILGGGGKLPSQHPAFTADAAGGKSSNAAQNQWHTRGNLRGTANDWAPSGPAAAGGEDGRFAQFLSQHGQHGGAAVLIGGEGRRRQPEQVQHAFQQMPPPPPPPPPQVSARGARGDFLSQVEQAEERDREDLEVLAQLQELEEQTELIEAAAAQIAAERGLDADEEERLRLRMLVHMHPMHVCTACASSDGRGTCVACAQERLRLQMLVRVREKASALRENLVAVAQQQQQQQQVMQVQAQQMQQWQQQRQWQQQQQC